MADLPSERAAIEHALLRYPLGFDRKDLDDTLAAFTADAIWSSPYSGDRSGRTELASFFKGAFEALEASVHLVGAPLIHEIDGASARCTSYFQSDVIYRSDDGADANVAHLDVGYYEDRMRNVDGTWLIDHRRIVLLMPTRRITFDRVAPAIPGS